MTMWSTYAYEYRNSLHLIVGLLETKYSAQ
jgi:hypothetical protein